MRAVATNRHCSSVSHFPLSILPAAGHAELRPLLIGVGLVVRGAADIFALAQLTMNNVNGQSCTAIRSLFLSLFIELSFHLNRILFLTGLSVLFRLVHR